MGETKKKDFNLGQALEEGLAEALAWKRGEIALDGRDVDPMSPERIKRIRRAAARSGAAFEARFGIPAATVHNWEQGRRRPDPAARLLLKLIEADPEAVAAAARRP